jgi:putative phage-type endonuclease
MLVNLYSEPSQMEKISIHYLSIEFFRQNMGATAEEFLKFCSDNISESSCKVAEQLTHMQGESPLWHNLRYARITASIAHAASKCHTKDGSLVEKVLGAHLKQTAALERGRKLESDVLKAVEKKLSLRFEKCGIYLLPQHPIFGASPDAITKDYVVEVKCPMSDKTFGTYFKNNLPNDIYMAQMQIQMYLTGRKKGIFCVAHPDFETTGNVEHVFVYIDMVYCEDLITSCTRFWKDCIFERIKL